MARVVLTGNLRQLAGADALEVDARNVRDVLAAVARRWPALAPHLDEGIAVAVDGQIFQDDWFAAVGPDSEVHLMPRIAGG